MKKLTLALSIAVAISSSAYADSEVTLTKTVTVDKDLTYRGIVRIGGLIRVDGLGMAVVENMQDSSGNMTDNSNHDNEGSIGNEAFSGATGNIGVNVAAGDNNVQANSAALASIDADFAFGSGDAEIFSQQSSMDNLVFNYGSTNTSSISGAAFAGAAGNIGVNVASGNNNVQANNMALSSYSGNLGEASVSNVQMVSDNRTFNEGVVENTVEDVTIDLVLEGVGSFSDSSGGSHSRSGGGGFSEAGDLELEGTITGQLPLFIAAVIQKTSNSASISGTSFAGASGNIGVNMASGTNNLQVNNLALTSISAAGSIVSE
ncbi:MAG: hypothetical protein V5788_10600 [Shewanella sp.]